MKVIILDDVEVFCAEHNFNTVGLDRLREMAIQTDKIGLNKAYMAGYGKCSDVVIHAMHDNKPSTEAKP